MFRKDSFSFLSYLHEGPFEACNSKSGDKSMATINARTGVYCSALCAMASRSAGCS